MRVPLVTLRENVVLVHVRFQKERLWITITEGLRGYKISGKTGYQGINDLDSNILYGSEIGRRVFFSVRNEMNCKVKRQKSVIVSVLVNVVKATKPVRVETKNYGILEKRVYVKVDPPDTGRRQKEIVFEPSAHRTRGHKKIDPKTWPVDWKTEELCTGMKNAHTEQV